MSSFGVRLHKNKILHEPFLMVFLVLGTSLSHISKFSQARDKCYNPLFNFISCFSFTFSVLSTCFFGFLKLCVLVAKFPAIKGKDFFFFFWGKAAISVSSVALILPASSMHWRCKSCLQNWCGFPPVPKCIVLGRETGLGHPETFGCFQRPGGFFWHKDSRPDPAFPDLQVRCFLFVCLFACFFQCPLFLTNMFLAGLPKTTHLAVPLHGLLPRWFLWATLMGIQWFKPAAVSSGIQNPEMTN